MITALLEFAVPVICTVIGTMCCIAFLPDRERKDDVVSMCTSMCRGCGWSYRGGSPPPIRCMKCGGPMAVGTVTAVSGGAGGGSMSVTPAHGSGGNGGSVSGGGWSSPGPLSISGGASPATAAHPPNPVPTSGCTCPMCVTAISQSIGSMVQNMPVQTTHPGRSVTPWGSGTRHLPANVPLTPSKATGAAAGMTGFGEQGGAEFDLAIGTVHGLRQWNLVTPQFNDDPARAQFHWLTKPMTGATGRFDWMPGVNEARCNNDASHNPPVDADPSGRACGCGFWAYWDIAALAAGGAMSLSLSSYVPITGVIEGSGRVLVGERGFRAQKARIIALAPAFSVQAYAPENYGDAWGRNMPRSRMINAGGYTDSPRDPHSLEEAEREQQDAQLRADAWMAVIQDRLEQLYPRTQVFATLKGMLASVTLGEISL